MEFFQTCEQKRRSRPPIHHGRTHLRALQGTFPVQGCSFVSLHSDPLKHTQIPPGPKIRKCCMTYTSKMRLFTDIDVEWLVRAKSYMDRKPVGPQVVFGGTTGPSGWR